MIASMRDVMLQKAPEDPLERKSSAIGLPNIIRSITLLQLAEHASSIAREIATDKDIVDSWMLTADAKITVPEIISVTGSFIITE